MIIKEQPRLNLISVNKRKASENKVKIGLFARLRYAVVNHLLSWLAKQNYFGHLKLALAKYKTNRAQMRQLSLRRHNTI